MLVALDLNRLLLKLLSPWPQQSALESEMPSLLGGQGADEWTEAAHRPGCTPS